MLVLLALAIAAQRPADARAGERVITASKKLLGELGIKGPYRLESLAESQDQNRQTTGQWGVELITGDRNLYMISTDTKGEPEQVSRGNYNYRQTDLPKNDQLSIDSSLIRNLTEHLLSLAKERDEVGTPRLNLYAGNVASLTIPILKNGMPYVGANNSYSILFRPDLNLVTQFWRTRYASDVNAKDPAISSVQATEIAQASLETKVIPQYKDYRFELDKAELNGNIKLAYYAAREAKSSRLAWLVGSQLTFKPKRSSAGPPHIVDIAIDALTGDYLGVEQRPRAFMFYPLKKIGPFEIEDDSSILFNRNDAYNPATDQDYQEFMKYKAGGAVGEDYLPPVRELIKRLDLGSEFHLIGLTRVSPYSSAWYWGATETSDGGQSYSFTIDPALKKVSSVTSFPNGPYDEQSPAEPNRPQDLAYANEMIKILAPDETFAPLTQLGRGEGGLMGAEFIATRNGLRFYNGFHTFGASISFLADSHRFLSFSIYPAPPVGDKTPSIDLQHATAIFNKYVDDPTTTDSQAKYLKMDPPKELRVELGYYKLKGETTARLVWGGRLIPKPRTSLPEDWLGELNVFVDAHTGELIQRADE